MSTNNFVILLQMWLKYVCLTQKSNYGKITDGVASSYIVSNEFYPFNRVLQINISKYPSYVYENKIVC